MSKRRRTSSFQDEENSDEDAFPEHFPEHSEEKKERRKKKKLDPVSERNKDYGFPGLPQYIS